MMKPCTGSLRDAVPRRDQQLKLAGAAPGIDAVPERHQRLKRMLFLVPCSRFTRASGPPTRSLLGEVRSPRLDATRPATGVTCCTAPHSMGAGRRPTLRIGLISRLQLGQGELPCQRQRGGFLRRAVTSALSTPCP
jgi:hypothetical protein